MSKLPKMTVYEWILAPFAGFAILLLIGAILLVDAANKTADQVSIWMKRKKNTKR